MKKLLVIAGLLFLGNAVRAQITLSSTSYPTSILGSDSLKETAHNSPFPSFIPMSGTLCDMTCLVDTIHTNSTFRVPAIGYSYADSGNYKLVGYEHIGKTLCSITGSCIAELGTYSAYTAYDLSVVTAGAFDSLFIPEQTSVFSGTHSKIAFPSTLGSSWNSNWSSTQYFEISLAAYSLYHATCTSKKITTENNIAIGWGMMRVNDELGMPSNYLDVLQVETVTQITDSFFLGGSPMPVTLLAALSLTQGKTDTTYTQNFYREREVTPLASVAFKDATFTQPYKATTHVQRLWPAGINEPATGSLSVFPNPAYTRMLTLQLPVSGTSWSYELIDLSGILVQSGSIKALGKTGTLEVNEAINNGVYLLRLNNGYNIYSQELVIQRVR